MKPPKLRCYLCLHPTSGHLELWVSGIFYPGYMVCDSDFPWGYLRLETPKTWKREIIDWWYD